MVRQRLGYCLLLAAAWQPAGGEVTSLGNGGFTVSHSVSVDAGPVETFAAMTARIDEWWDAGHTWSGDAGNLYIQDRAGGCFCERLPGGGSVEHLRIVQMAPGRLVLMQGGLGPLQGMGLHGSMAWKVSELESATTVAWTYTVHGHLEGGFESVADAVDGVLGEQLARLRRLLEASAPTP